jgi:hypothetical protein
VRSGAIALVYELLSDVIFISRNLSHEKPGIFLSSKISDTLIIPPLPPTSKQGLCKRAKHHDFVKGR